MKTQTRKIAIKTLIVRAECMVSLFLICLLVPMSAYAWRSHFQAIQSRHLASRALAFWNTLTVMGCEAEHYKTLEAMAESADAVALGRFTSFTLSRTLQGDAEEDRVSLGLAMFEVSSVVRGTSFGPTIPVEFLLPDVAYPIQEVVAQQAADLPKEEVLLFLRRKRGSNDAPFFRLTNSKGLWVETSRGLETPLAPAEEASEADDVSSRLAIKFQSAGPSAYPDELVGVTSLSQLADKLRR